jgi:hypothetical protein
MGRTERWVPREHEMKFELVKAIEHLRKVLQIAEEGGRTGLTTAERGLRDDAKSALRELRLDE